MSDQKTHKIQVQHIRYLRAEVEQLERKRDEALAEAKRLREALRPFAEAFRARSRDPQASYWAYVRAAELVPEE